MLNFPFASGSGTGDVKTCFTIGIDESGRGYSLTGKVHLTGFSCYEGTSTVADLWTDSTTFSVTEKSGQYADCAEFEISNQTWSKCDYVMWALELNTVTNINFVHGNYSISIKPS